MNEEQEQQQQPKSLRELQEEQAANMAALLKAVSRKQRRAMLRKLHPNKKLFGFALTFLLLTACGKPPAQQQRQQQTTIVTYEVRCEDGYETKIKCKKDRRCEEAEEAEVQGCVLEQEGD